MLQPDLLTKREGTVEILFIREGTLMTGFATSANITMNKAPLARLHAGEKFSIWVDQGLYQIGMSPSEFHVANAQVFDPSRKPLWKVEVEARTGRRYEVRMDLTNWTGIPLQASSEPIN